MRVLIVDDEATARARLRSLLAEIDPGIEVVGEAANGLDALRLTEAARPDIILLDIRMPRLDGLNVAREIARLTDPPALVFATAYDDYALDAFNVAAVDYLLKPVRKERLATALERARRFSRGDWQRLEAILAPAATPARSHFCVHAHGDLRLIPVETIVYFRADSKYTTIRSNEGEALIEDSLVSLEEEFGDRFPRIHRNALVARDRILGLEKLPGGSIGVSLRGVPERLEVSRRHLPVIRTWLKSQGNRAV